MSMGLRDKLRMFAGGLLLAFMAAFPLAAYRDAGAGFEWRQPPYEYEYEKPPIDILFGSRLLREGLANGESARDIARAWAPDVERFETLRQKFLRY